MKVPFVNLGLQFQNLQDEITEKFVELSSTGAYVLGTEVAAFEERFAEYCGTRYAVGVGNGSDALTFSLLALGIGKGDEVITVPNSFVATAWTIANVGARPVFVDVCSDYNIDPKQIESSITPRTKALMPVHLTGRVANMDAILEIASKHKIPVIEDAAQAAGAIYKGKKAGSFGTTGCFSLHPLKNLHVHGDGGIVTTNDGSIYEYIRKIRNHGLRNRDECEFWGYNSRLDGIQAAVANIKLNYLDAWNHRYRKIAHRYSQAFASYLSVPKDKEFEKPIYHCYIVEHPERDTLGKYLANKGIETKVHYPIPLHMHEAAKSLGYRRGDFPITERLSKTILSLPIYAELRDDQVEYVVDCLNSFEA